MKFTIYNIETAQEKSKPLLANSIESFGMIPNLHGVLAESPAALEGYQQLHRLFQETSFDKEELTVVWQTINMEHDCHYCVPAHIAVAHSMEVDTNVIDALASGSSLPTTKLNVLKETTLTLIRNRGNITEAEVTKFTEVGYTQKNILEVVLGIAQKTMSNYVNHICKTPVDDPFKKFA